MEHYKERYAEILLDLFNEMDRKGDLSLMVDLIKGEISYEYNEVE